jgi:hypothetical protein
MMPKRFVIALSFLLAGATAALAQGAAAPTLLGTFEDWSAFSYDGTYKGNTPGKVCYIFTELQDDNPKKKPPKGAMMPTSLKHGRVTFSITSSPSQGVQNESSFVAGYAFKEQSPVTVDIDGRKFNMFTEGDSAWLINTAEEPQLLEAMKSGTRMTVTAQSRKGNETTYKYSLDGVTAAADKMMAECK